MAIKETESNVQLKGGVKGGQQGVGVAEHSSLFGKSETHNPAQVVWEHRGFSIRPTYDNGFWGATLIWPSFPKNPDIHSSFCIQAEFHPVF